MQTKNNIITIKPIIHLFIEIWLVKLNIYWFLCTENRSDYNTEHTASGAPMHWGLLRKYRYWSRRELLLTCPRKGDRDRLSQDLLKFKYQNRSEFCGHRTRRLDCLQRCEKWPPRNYLIWLLTGVHCINCQGYWQAQKINRPPDWSS